MPHLADAVKTAHAGGDLPSIYKVCANTEGKIVAVFTVQSIPEADSAIADTIRQWRLKPQPVGVCTLVRFVFRTDMPPAKKR
jgi:hypothetical protein